MKKGLTRLLGVFIAAAALAAGVFYTAGASETETGKTYRISVTGELIYDQSQRFVELINAERAKLGRPPMALDQEMMGYAATRSVQGSIAFGHCLPTGEDVRSSASPFTGKYSGENGSAKSQGTAEAFVEGWKNSNLHWEVLMDTHYTRLGFVIYHQAGNNKDFYSFAVMSDDTGRVGDTLVPYTGTFGRKPVTMEMDIAPMYLRMRSVTERVEKGEVWQLRPKYDTADAERNGVPDERYDYGVGWLDNTCGYWESDNPSVVSVDSAGKAAARKVGTAVVRFYVNGDRTKYFQDTITVESDSVVVEEPDHLAAPSLKAGTYKRQYADLSWKPVKNAKGYMIYMSSSVNGKYTKIKTITSGKTLSYRKKLGYGKSGYFKIRACGGTASLGSYSKAVKVLTAPGKEKLSGISAGKRKITLRWKKAAGASGYQVYRAASAKGKYVKVKTITKGNTLSWTDTGRKKGKRYYYKVRAYRKNGASKIYGSFSAARSARAK